MKIWIKNNSHQVKVSQSEIRKIVRKVLKNEGCQKKYRISIFITNNKMMKYLNKKYLGRNTTTDVLAFQLGINDKILDEIIVSDEVARKEAKKRNIPVSKELKLYIVHGVLHLLGYRDKRKDDFIKMKEKEAFYLDMPIEKVVS